MKIMHATDQKLATWEHILLGDILAKHWDGTHHDSVMWLPGEYWTDADYSESDGEGRFRLPVSATEFAQHLDTSPNVG